MKKLLFTLLVLAIIAGGMAMTCPTRQQHLEAINTVTDEWVNDKVNSNGLGLLGGQVAKLLGHTGTNFLIENNLTIDNYILFSVGKLNFDNKEHVVSVGLCNKVITFDKEDIDKAMAEMQDDLFK